jgi:formate hydrogenlyase subunit 6/NADH:ubiquinone oxidoreductase subunit I
MGTIRKRKSWHIEIDTATCVQCAGCVAICPTQALTMTGLALGCADPRCIGCDLCVRFCPVAALRLEEQPAGPAPQAAEEAL